VVADASSVTFWFRSWWEKQKTREAQDVDRIADLHLRAW